MYSKCDIDTDVVLEFSIICEDPSAPFIDLFVIGAHGQVIVDFTLLSSSNGHYDNHVLVAFLQRE